MIAIRDFRPADFEALVDCYRTGFPEGHNRYSLSRLCRFQRDSILVAEHRQRIVGVLIGITSSREAWMTGMSVLPESRYRYGTVSMRLLAELGDRFLQMGFREALGTTNRGAMIGIAKACGAKLVSEEPNFYWDGREKLIFKAEPYSLVRLKLLILPFGSI